MIKLNNKNITYVALADANNSLKAPKEIWYADTNNSVKLVYRRKDALIEGEDYEKYHWLQGRNGAYIDTRYVPIPSEDSFKFKINNNGFWKNPNNNDPHVFGVYSPRIRFGTFASVENRYFFQYSNVAEGVAPYFSSSDYIQEITLLNDGMKTKCIANGIENEYETTITEQFNYSIWLYAINDKPSKYFHGDIAYFRITDSTFVTDKLHLIPCKLLKPVPKWLDANGIRRQVGECGMIDLVSGKFYGNVSSNGTFTVENYYEKKEWLVGDGNANIYGTLICTDYLEWKLAQYSGQYVALNYGELSDNSHQFQLSVNNNATDTIGVFFNDTHTYVSLSQQSINDIKFLVNSQIIGIINNVNIENNNSNLKFNGKISLNLIAKSGGISKITVDNKERYIPCTLTMDLPASMDANNIARTKGTSGMWDLVSDRFYGNVANSGTFKAVNLAEGVDYEVHQWLVGDGSAYINTLITKFDGIVDISFYFSSYNGSIFGRERKDSSIEDYSDRFVVMINNNVTPNGRIYGKDTNGAELSIANDEQLIIDIDNGVATNKNGDTATISVMANVTGRNLYLFADNYRDSPYNNRFNGRIGLFSISNKIHLIPVKLLKSIPSKYDANGRARQEGECGMYDTVNDVFYGNVASSGTFSVEDDN